MAGFEEPGGATHEKDAGPIAMIALKAIILLTFAITVVFLWLFFGALLAAAYDLGVTIWKDLLC